MISLINKIRYCQGRSCRKKSEVLYVTIFCYLNHAAVNGQGGADHVDIWGGRGPLALRQGWPGGRVRSGVVKGVRCWVSVQWAERHEEYEEDPSGAVNIQMMDPKQLKTHDLTKL